MTHWWQQAICTQWHRMLPTMLWLSWLTALGSSELDRALGCKSKRLEVQRRQTLLAPLQPGRYHRSEPITDMRWQQQVTRMQQCATRPHMAYTQPRLLMRCLMLLSRQGHVGRGTSAVLQSVAISVMPSGMSGN